MLHGKVHEKKVNVGFHEMRWVTIEEVEKLVSDPNTLKVLGWLQNTIFNDH